MRRTIIKSITISLIALIMFALFVLPIFKIDQKYLFEKYDFLVQEIIKTDDPKAAIDHTFTKETFDKANLGLIELDEDAKSSWGYDYSGKYEESLNGVTFEKGFHLTKDDFSDFVRLAIWASGKDATITVKVNNNVIRTHTLTSDDTLEKCVFETEVVKDAKITISFTGPITLNRIKVNEDDIPTLEVARGMLVERMIFFSGIVINDPEKIKVSEKEVLGTYDDIEQVLSGIGFVSLFNMAIQDIKYNFHQLGILFEIGKETSGIIPFDALFNQYQQLRLCPFVSILIFISAALIIASIIYIIIAFILDLIFKKDRINYKIPALIILASLMIILNISTFITSSFFDGTHNIATEYRLLLFEVINYTPSFYVVIALIILLGLIPLADVVLEYIENKKEEKKNSKVKLISYSTITSCMFILVILGLLIK